MDHDEADPEKGRARELMEALMWAYDIILHQLAGLPIPIGLPPIDQETWDPQLAIPAVDRSRSLISEEPIPEILKIGFEGLVLEWLVAYELAAAIKSAGPAPWRVDGLDTALGRIAAGLRILRSMLEDE